MRSRHVSIVIRRPATQVYAFAAQPENLSHWASGLARGEVKIVDGKVLCDTPAGPVTVVFAATNDLGVLDHDVTIPSGEVTSNPLRVLPHPEGAEVIFTLRQLALSDEEFSRDARMVAEDLERLRRLVEDESPKSRG